MTLAETMEAELVAKAKPGGYASVSRRDGELVMRAVPVDTWSGVKANRHHRIVCEVVVNGKRKVVSRAKFNDLTA